MKFKNGIANIIVGVLSQVIIMALGVVVPRFVLINYGSEVNGVFNSISQIYTYIALLEAGVGASTLQALYKHIDKREEGEISGIVSAAHKYYKGISAVYAVCVFVFGIVFSMATKTAVSRVYILLIFWLQGIVGVINFRFVAAEKTLLTAEGKDYLTGGVTTVATIITSVGKIILVNLQINIVLLQVFYCSVTLSQLLFYYIYFKKKYPWLDLSAPPNGESLRSKNDFMITQIAWTVFSCSDMVILSLFCDFKVVSVYAIYNLVFSSLSALLNSTYNGTQFILSRMYHQDKNEYIKLHDLYECLFNFLVFATMSVCCISVLPFIKLYTAGVTDIVYVDRYLPLLFALVQLISWPRYVCGNLINISGHVKKVTAVSVWEAVINITVSVALVMFIGIHGVLIGTVCALLLKSTYAIIYANTKILYRSPIRSILLIGVDAVMFVLSLWVGGKIDMTASGYGEWIIKTGVVGVVVFTVFLAVNILINVRSFKYLWTLVSSRVGALGRFRKKGKEGQ